MPDQNEIAGIQSVNRAAHSAFVSIDEEGRVTWWNPAAERLFGWLCDEVIGRAVADVLIPPEIREAHWRGLTHFLATGHGPVLDETLEVEALHKDGHRIPVEMTITSLELDDGWTFHAFLRDVAERRHADAAATAALVHASLAAARAAEYERALRDYHSIMRHRIGNPLTIIIGSAMTLRDLETISDDARQRLLEMIVTSARELEDVTLKADPVTPEEVGLQPRPESREDELIANEQFFRSINAQIAGSATLASRNHVPLVCECSDPACTIVIYVTRDRYATIRAHSDHFAIHPGHERREIEDVIDRTAGTHWVVAKRTP